MPAKFVEGGNTATAHRQNLLCGINHRPPEPGGGEDETGRDTLIEKWNEDVSPSTSAEYESGDEMGCV
jgi:hypothetical protein